jgi:hypothetical protein
VHDGTSRPALDTSQGLVSAIGGQDVHGLEFVGAAIMPTQTGTSLILEEPNQSDPGTGNFVNWSSHPATIGYRRAGRFAVSALGASRCQPLFFVFDCPGRRLDFGVFRVIGR